MRDATHYVTSARLDVPVVELAAYAASRFAAVPLDPAAPTGPSSTAVAVVANHGRWVVGCPDCTGALLAHPGDPRFLCVTCGNAAVGGKYRPVIWPKQYEQIGQLLDARTNRRLRNWSPGEKVADLRRENRLLASAPALLEIGLT